MKIFLLANPNSVHTKKWVTSLCEKGLEIVLFSLHSIENNYYAGLPNFKSYSLDYNNDLNRKDSKFKKLSYLTAVLKIKKAIAIEKPDIVHSHYASSYGLLGALSKFHPFIISVWGSDIYEFPHSSFIAKKIIKYNLSKADQILSTSHAMAIETKKYTNKEIEETPFGVDLTRFMKTTPPRIFGENDIVIGTIKSLEKVYGIEYLIEAFNDVVINNPEKSLRLLIVGNGSCESELKSRVKELQIEDKVLFAGFVNHSEIVSYYNNIDIFVVPSIRESFGVSVIEASACELPVIVSNTGGLPEVVENNSTGFIVPPQNSKAIAEAIEILLNDKMLISEMGKAGRKMVETKYNWPICVERMIDIYNKALKK
ncbi:MAG: glycosyltransferase [Bacteroidetes bacterium]|nr:glycosyltransferase [Bacteroidota bacterium]